MKLANLLLTAIPLCFVSCQNSKNYPFIEWTKKTQQINYDFDRHSEESLEESNNHEIPTSNIDSISYDIRKALGYDEGYSKGIYDFENNKGYDSLFSSIKSNLLKDTCYVLGYKEGYFDAFNPGHDDNLENTEE